MPYHLREDCPRCKGAGEYETVGDLHKSAGVVPCDHWYNVTKEPRSYQQATRAMSRDMLSIGSENARLRARVTFLEAALEEIATYRDRHPANVGFVHGPITNKELSEANESMRAIAKAALEWTSLPGGAIVGTQNSAPWTSRSCGPP